MTPKSLLRHKEAISMLEDLTEGEFKTVILDDESGDRDEITRIVFCSGKVYYDILKKHREDGLRHVAIVRIEQLYPFPEQDLAEVISEHPNIDTAVWCQEEPVNQGAWYSSQHHLRRVLHKSIPALYLHYAGREGSAAPAAGYMSLHIQQQDDLVHEALYKTDID